MFFTEGIEVAASVVELNHLFQRQLAAIVEIRSGQRDIAQLRRFKEAASRRFVATIQWRHGDAVSRTSRDHDCLARIVADALSQIFRLRERLPCHRICACQSAIFRGWPYTDVVVASVVNTDL